MLLYAFPSHLTLHPSTFTLAVRRSHLPMLHNLPTHKPSSQFTIPNSPFPRLPPQVWRAISTPPIPRISFPPNTLHHLRIFPHRPWRYQKPTPRGHFVSAADTQNQNPEIFRKSYNLFPHNALPQKEPCCVIFPTLVSELESSFPRASCEARSAIYGGALQAGVPVPPMHWGRRRLRFGDYSTGRGNSAAESRWKSRNKVSAGRCG